jgi:hypothetical protein
MNWLSIISSVIFGAGVAFILYKRTMARVNELAQDEELDLEEAMRSHSNRAVDMVESRRMMPSDNMIDPDEAARALLEEDTQNGGA